MQFSRSREVWRGKTILCKRDKKTEVEGEGIEQVVKTGLVGGEVRHYGMAPATGSDRAKS